MDTLSFKTGYANKANVEKKWYVVDAEDQPLGRMASKVAKIIRGKHKTSFSPHVDCGDHVIIINAEKVALTGKKMFQKTYLHHTGYPGGQRATTARELLIRKPIAMVERSVKGMLPKNRLGSQLFHNLHVFEGAEHTHEAQKPEKLDLNNIK